MKRAFHLDATIFGYVGPDLFVDPIQGLFDWNDQTGTATGLSARLGSIDIVETIATVRVEMDNWTGRRFIDVWRSRGLRGTENLGMVLHLNP